MVVCLQSSTFFFPQKAYRGKTYIGSGAFSKVFVQNDKAVKEIPLEWVTKAPANQAKIYNEISLQQRMSSSDHFPTFHGAFQDDEYIYLESDYISNGTLQKFVGYRLADDVLLRVFIDMASFVRDCHDRFIIHKDIKPANFLIDKRLQVYGTDLGLL